MHVVCLLSLKGGAGKSTVAQLLPRLYEVNKGIISIDGMPISEFTQRSLREEIAFVPQKPFLFLDSIKENISFGRSYTEKEIIDAAKMDGLSLWTKKQ